MSLKQKERRLIVTFYTTADAMAMEKACKEQAVPGRIIPVPREISAGCGLAWCANPDDRDQVTDLLARVGIEAEEIRECMV